MANPNKYFRVHSLLNCRFSEYTFHFFRIESYIVLIQPGRTIIKTTLGANFEVECAKQLRGAMQKLTKQSVAGACGEDCCGRRLAEQVYAVLRGDERGQLISAPIRPAV